MHSHLTLVSGDGDPHPTPHIISVEEMAIILRDPNTFLKANSSSACPPPDLLLGAGEKSLVLPIPELSLMEIEARFQDRMHMPILEHEDRLAWDGMREEQQPASWLRFDFPIRRFDEREFTPRRVKELAGRNRRLPNARELVLLFLALPRTSLFTYSVKSLVSGSETERVVRQVIVIAAQSGGRLRSVRTYARPRNNLSGYSYLLVQEPE